MKPTNQKEQQGEYPNCPDECGCFDVCKLDETPTASEPSEGEKREIKKPFD